MKTKIKTFKRGNKTITLIGIMHVGTENYYKIIQDLLDNNKDITTLCEGVKGLDIDVTNIQKNLAKVLDVKTQGEFIKHHKNCINSDIDADCLEAVIGGKSKDLEKLSMFEDEEVLMQNKRYFKTIILLSFKFTNIIQLFKRHTAIIEFRNKNLLIEMFNYLSFQDSIFVLYGDLHLKGIEKFIKRTGFKMTKKEILKPLK